MLSNMVNYQILRLEFLFTGNYHEIPGQILEDLKTVASKFFNLPLV